MTHQVILRFGVFIFSNPLGLLALLGLPLIYWIHRFHRRPHTKVVSSIHLWASLNDAPKQGNVQQTWINSLSFWLELFGIILLSLLLSEPIACSNDGYHRVLVVDVSASMQSTENHVERVTSSIQKFRGTDRVSIVAAGQRPFMVVQHTEPYLAIKALESLSFEHPKSDLVNALQVADQLTTGEIEVWTDKVFSETSEQITIHANGDPLSNVGLTYGEWSQGVIHLQVSNFSPSSNNITLRFQIPNVEDDAVLFEQEVALSANQQQSLQWTPPSGLQHLEIVLTADGDGFTLDNTIWLHPAERNELTIASDLPSNLSNVLGLNTMGQGIFALDTQLQVATPMTADILFTNRKIGGGPNTWRIEMAKKANSSTQWHGGSFNIDTKHPLLHNVKLTNILWSFDPTMRLQGTPLISIQDVPVLTEKIGRQGRRSYRFNIGSNSTLFQHPDWPIFINALLKSKRDEQPGLTNTTLQAGDTLTGTGLSSGIWQLQTPYDTLQVEVIEGLLDQRVERIGYYTLGQNNTISHTFGVNLLSSEESNLQDGSTEEKQSTILPESIESSDHRNQLWLWLAFIVCWLWDWRITR